jgi:hypothetical protein
METSKKPTAGLIKKEQEARFFLKYIKIHLRRNETIDKSRSI